MQREGCTEEALKECQEFLGPQHNQPLFDKLRNHKDGSTSEEKGIQRSPEGVWTDHMTSLFKPELSEQMNVIEL